MNHKNKRKGILVILLVFILTTCLGACMYGNEKLEESKVEVSPVSEPTIELKKDPSELENLEGSWIDPMENLAEFGEVQVAAQQEIHVAYVDDYDEEDENSVEIPDVILGWPIPDYYKIKAPFGWRLDDTDFHTGIDISGDNIYGAPVIAAADGKVLTVNRKSTPGAGYGMYIVIEHEKGVSTLYAHLSGILVKEGQKVKQGEKIGEAGNTGFSDGAHLHFETRVNGMHVDPQAFYPEESK